MSGFYFIQTDTGFCSSRLTVKPILIINEEFTDNVDLTPSDTSHDFISIWSPGFILDYKSRRHAATFKYDFGYSRYEEKNEYNSWRHNANINISSALSRHTVMSFGNVFRITEDPNAEFIDKIFEDLDSYFLKQPEKSKKKEEDRRDRLQYLTNNVYLNLSHQFSQLDSVSLNYFNSLLINEDNTIRDERTHSPSIQFNYWIVPRRFMADGGISYSFDDTSDSLVNSGSVEQRLSPFIGAEYWILPNRFNMTPRLTYSRKTISDAPEADRWEETFSPSLGLKYFFRDYHMDASLNGRYERGVGNDDPETSDSQYDFDSWYGEAQIGKTFNSSFRGFIQYNIEYKDYFEDDLRDYQTYEPSVGITYTLLDKLPLTLRVGYSVKDEESQGKTSDLTVNGSGSWRFSRNGELRFRVSSGYDNDDFGADQLGRGIYYDGDFSLNYNFSNDFKGIIYGLYEKNMYDRDGIETRNDEKQIAGAGFFYRLTKWIMMRLDYVHVNYVSTDSLDDYKENRIIFKIHFKPEKSYQLN